MIKIIPFETLGHQDHGWLDARHHFSFARYFNRNRMGYPPLIVWNDDTIQGGTGFPMHSHDNMEIITYIREGSITHSDSMGNEGRIVKGQIQVMSAGTGIVHSEFNRESKATILFQIWIQASQRNVEPRWETREFPDPENGEWIVCASGKKQDKVRDAVLIHQNASLVVGKADKGTHLKYDVPDGRHAYLVAPDGKFESEAGPFKARDGVYVPGSTQLDIEATEPGSIVLVDIPLL